MHIVTVSMMSLRRYDWDGIWKGRNTAIVKSRSDFG